MKTLWALAALLALGNAAHAGTKTQVISLDGHCDVLTLKINKTEVVGADTPSCATGIGIGYIGKVKGFGNGIIAGAQFSTAPGAQFVIRIAYPLVTGGSWDLAVTSDGATFTPYESGTYTVDGTADRAAPPVASGAQ
jgi:hypothetical protein